MSEQPISNRIWQMIQVTEPIIQFINESRWSKVKEDPQICDFMLGNPHEMPLKGFAEALQKWSVPQNKDWFAYKMNEEDAREVVLKTIQHRLGLPFESEDIFLTNGAFAGLAICLRAIVDAGDEVIFISPPWFFYESLILSVDGVPVRVRCQPGSFDLDLDAIRQAITPRTRGIIINNPHNPTGKIYPPETLEALAGIIGEAGQRNSRPLYLLSDEAYYRIVYNGRSSPSPAAFYPHTFVIYTYGKTLLTPGQRMGYVALPPTMPDREWVRDAMMMAQMITGYAFPNALLQHALPDLEKLSIDVSRLQARRDRLVPALRGMGYETTLPEGTFYVLVRAPLEDDMAFINLLADQNVYCLPGSVFEMPGYFRVSLTANDEMIDRGLPGFAAAMEQVKARRISTQA